MLCDVADASNSGSALYRVHLEGRCYRARKITPDIAEEPPHLERVLTECVGLRDQVRFFDRAWD